MDEFQLRKKSYPSTGTKGKTILVTSKRKTEPILSILYDGKDLTPKPLNPEIFAGGRERQLSVFDIGLDRSDREGTKQSRSASLSIFKSQSNVRFKTELGKTHVSNSAQYRGSIVYDSNFFDVFVEDVTTSDEQCIPTSTDTLTPLFVEEDMLPTMKKIPSHVSLVLNETNTFFLLDLPSSTELKDTSEGDLAEAENDNYLYLTEGKGRNRKVLTAEVQTLPIMVKTRNTECPQVKTNSDSAFASNWDMYDTYQDVQKTEKEESEESEESDSEIHKLDDNISIDSYRLSVDEKQMNKLIKNPKFLEAVCVIERLLASNRYKEQQNIFRGLAELPNFRENIEYKYQLKHLWTFTNNNTKGSSVNSMNWNSRNKDLLAVGYGKFYFSDNIPGLVCIWNIKNPVQPERQYSFAQPVTAVHFSNLNPMLLAVGFYNGSVVVLNVVSREKMIIGENTPTFEPVWDISWQYGQQKEEEYVWATFNDGRICSYSVQRKLESFQLMRVAKADGKLKGFNAMKKCSNLTIPVSRYASALFMRPHPKNKSLYYVGTNEGVIHQCSVNYLNQHLDLFIAHDGPIHEMKFSPFSNKIFATCGDDWQTRIWAEGIAEPILETFVTMQSVQGVDWSPAYSTIFATIRGNGIQIWDLQRKVYAPQSSTTSPSNSRNTQIQFTESGRCIIVGDVDGNVHVFSLEDMPFPAFFQENLLFESLSRALITNQNLLAKLKKLRQPSTTENII